MSATASAITCCSRLRDASARRGAYYGWPWYYIGNHEDPRLKGRAPRFGGGKGRRFPMFLLQPHSASLEMTFYDGNAFPSAYKGDGFFGHYMGRGIAPAAPATRSSAFATEHGIPTGEYEDFLVGFVVDNDKVWGRPVGVAVAHGRRALGQRRRQRHDSARHV